MNRATTFLVGDRVRFKPGCAVPPAAAGAVMTVAERVVQTFAFGTFVTYVLDFGGQRVFASNGHLRLERVLRCECFGGNCAGAGPHGAGDEDECQANGDAIFECDGMRAALCSACGARWEADGDWSRVGLVGEVAL